jgi:hypothetical protein
VTGKQCRAPTGGAVLHCLSVTVKNHILTVRQDGSDADMWVRSDAASG